MVFGIAMLVVLYLLWVLFVSGALWKIFLFVGGWIGLYLGLSTYVQAYNSRAGSFSGVSFTWAFVIATAICIFAMASTKAD